MWFQLVKLRLASHKLSLKEPFKEVDQLIVPQIPGVPTRRHFAILIRYLPLGQSFDEPPVVNHEDVLIAAGPIEHWHGLDRDAARRVLGSRSGRSGDPGLPNVCCSRGGHVHVRGLTRNQIGRAQCADGTKQLMVFQTEQIAPHAPIETPAIARPWRVAIVR